MKNLTAIGWQDYELLDAGEGQRLERFGPYTVVRPDPNVLWPKSNAAHPGWSQPDALFLGKDRQQPWKLAAPALAEGWEVRWKNMVLKVKPTPFRHMGVFPEQTVHWEWLQATIAAAPKPPKVLNVFAYTGASTIVAALAGAHVTHLDASKGTVFWASENARLSGLGKDSVRWIVDDAVKFMRREVRRGARYDLILMDPPVFGRGPRGEVWRIEEGLGELYSLAAQLLTEPCLGLLVNFYATDLYPQSIERLADHFLAKKTGELALYSVCLREEMSKKLLPTGFCLRT